MTEEQSASESEAQINTNQATRQFIAPSDSQKTSSTKRLVSESYRRDYQQALLRPGSAEFLSKLLTEPNQSCVHFPKLLTGPGTDIPSFLGFFHDVKPCTGDTPLYKQSFEAPALAAGEWYISRLQTNLICATCYQRAVPEGFNTWLVKYNNSIHHRGMPPQVNAGTERFEIGGIVFHDQLIFSPKVVNSGVEAPNKGYLHFSEAGAELYDYLEHLGNPFYIDLLHSEHPYDPYTPETAENTRLEYENSPAYRGAKWIIVENTKRNEKWSSTIRNLMKDKILTYDPDWRQCPRGQVS